MVQEYLTVFLSLHLKHLPQARPKSLQFILHTTRQFHITFFMFGIGVHRQVTFGEEPDAGVAAGLEVVVDEAEFGEAAGAQQVVERLSQKIAVAVVDPTLKIEQFCFHVAVFFIMLFARRPA